MDSSIVIHFFSVDSSTVFDLFWQYKEAAASTVCLTGIPCHLFYFCVGIRPSHLL